MNGLKFIRNRCNLSLNDLAGTLGVSRQALSNWEMGKKPIPPHRQKQLSEFFGISEEYFGDITEEKRKELLEKAMFRNIENGKEYYRYKPRDKDNLDGEKICFLGDSEQTLDEIYISCQKEKQALMAQINEIMLYYNKGTTLNDRIAALNRGQKIYGAVTDLMNEMPKQSLIHRMAHFSEIKHILNAMLLAYGLITEDELETEYAHSSGTVYDGMDWIRELSVNFREHRQKIFDDLNESDRKFRENQKNKRNSESESEKQLSVEEQIRQAEEQNRTFWQEHPEMMKQSGMCFSVRNRKPAKDQ